VSQQPGTLELALLELGRSVGTVGELLADHEVLDTFADLGVRFDAAFISNPQVTTARTTIATAADRLTDQVAALETAIETGGADDVIAAAVPLGVSVAQLIEALPQLAQAIQAAGTSLGVTAQQITDLVADLPARLLDLLLLDVLGRLPQFRAALEVLGVVERTFVPGDPADRTKPDHERLVVHLDRLVGALTNPVQALETTYAWGQPGFDAAKLLTALDGAIAHLGLPVALNPASGGTPITLESFGVDLIPLAGSPGGLALTIVEATNHTRTFTVPISPPDWNATITAAGAVAAGATGSVQPPLDVTLSQPGGSASASVDVALSATPATPLLLLGEAGGSRLEVASVTLAASADIALDPASGSVHGGPGAKAAVTGGKLVIDTSQGDGFITTLLGDVHMESDFAFQAAFAPDTGLRFEGSGSLVIQIPVHVSLGPVDISSIYLVAGIDNGTLPLELSAAMSAQLGPLGASVDRLGAIITISFPSGGGNAGPVDIGVKFKPPTGVGLSIDAAVITGGGFLSIDTERGEYAGALQLEIADFIGVAAIGLISTKNPDGTPGFSLLIILTADFGPGIQLGFGFTLNAVGGLLGLNRTMLFQPLMDGVRSGAIDSIMFPRDVVANAPRIISDLRAIFPPQQGTFLIGPMAKLGWGEPTLVSVSLGVIIEIPPGDIAILGVLRVALPADEIAILVLQVNFAGALEFSKQRLYFFASLYDSHILFITIAGEMGLLFAWGDDANFVLSIGGFHPQFNPPPLPFPSPQRIQVDIINESYARIRCDGYFAVTTNTVQFGAHSEMYFGLSAVNVQGHTSFDALIQFSPFHFIVDFSTSFSVNVFGIGVFGLDIAAEVSGPTPFHVHGTASISLLFFSIDVNVDFTWGDTRDTTLPPVAVMPIVAGELAKRTNWKAQLPSGSNLLVSLRKLPPDEAALVLHPVGTLQVSQTAVPLDLTIDKVGSQKPNDANRFSLAVTSTGLTKLRDLQAPFAPAQFKDADDASRLSEPAFSPQDSGVELGVDGHVYDTATAVTRVVRYDLRVIDTALIRQRFFVYPGALFQHWMAGSSVAMSALSAHFEGLTHPEDGAVVVSAEVYAVALAADNTLLHAEATFSSRAAAIDHMDRAVAADASLSGTLHVLPQFEVAA
jgi:hypothetical protein